MGGHSGGGGGHGGGDYGGSASTGSGSTWESSLAASRADDAAADYSDLHVEQNLPEGMTHADKTEEPLGTGRWGALAETISQAVSQAAQRIQVGRQQPPRRGQPQHALAGTGASSTGYAVISADGTTYVSH